jgi:dephospho-CoA kinase
MRVAFCGLARSGKDTAVQHLVSRYHFMRLAFGDKLKEYAEGVFLVEEGKKPRELYQWFGQKMRERDPDIWVKHVEKKMDMYPNFNFCISDLRQPNEYDWCREQGFVIVRINANTGHRLHRMANDDFKLEDLTHETESHVSNFVVDYDLFNDGTKQDLFKQVDTIIENL